MNILSLKVQNFRAFEGTEREIRITLREGLNVIVGENNVGKSSLLRALRIVGGQVESNPLDSYKGENEELLLELELELDNSELKRFVSNITANSKHLENPGNLKRFTEDFGNKIFLTYSSKSGLSATHGKGKGNSREATRP